MDVLTVVLLVALGICSGGMTSLIGASGVMVVIPALSMGMKFTMQQAIGTSLMVDVIGSIVVSYTYFRNKNIDLKRGIWIAAGSVGGAQLGAMFADWIPESDFGSAFGIFLAIFGVFMLVRGANTGKSVSKIDRPARLKAGWQTNLASLGIGFVLGIISGVAGAGGGINFLIVLLFVVRLPLHKAIGTSTLIMAITALSGAIGHGARGNIDLVAGLIIGIGTIIGGLLGARFANRVSEKVLARVTGGIFVVLGLAMTFIALKQLGIF